MVTITRVMVPFDGGRCGTTKATFGQRAVWFELKVIEPHTQVLNINQLVEVPAGLTLPDVLAALGDLLLRHECLRARFRVDDQGVLWQDLAGRGEFPIEVWEVERSQDAEAAAEAATDEFDLARLPLDRPVRMLLGVVDGVPSLLVVGVSHLAADMLSVRLICGDLADLLGARASGQPAPVLPARRQPLDQAAIEQSAAGQRNRGQVLTSWHRRLETVPRTMFPAPPAADGADRYLHAILTSQALPLAVDVLGRRHQVSTAIAVMAAEAILLGHQAAADQCAIQVSVGNRTAPDMAASAGVFKQHSLAVIDLRDASFDQIVRRTWKAWLLAQRTGWYDPAEVTALRRGLELSRGVALDLACVFNDLRRTTQPVMAEVAPERILTVASASTFSYEKSAAYYAKFQLRLKEEGLDAGRRQPPPGSPRRVLMHAFADGWVLPPGKLRELMFGIERLLIWQATDEAAAEQVLDPQTIADRTGMPAPVARSGWVRLYGGLVEVAAVSRLLSAAAADTCPQATAGPRVAVLRRPGLGSGDDERLIGYVAVRDGAAPTPEQLHQACVARLTNAPPHGLLIPDEVITSYPPQWLSAVAPQHYVVCADVPGMPYDDAGWLARPVLAEGTGRPVQDFTPLAALG